MSVAIHLISPASSPAGDLVEQRIRDLNKYGEFRLTQGEVTKNLTTKVSIIAMETRRAELLAALSDPAAPILLAARGGYGASDLLEHIPWEKLRMSTPRVVVGFSDISCLISAFWTKLGWPGIHGPMPGSSLWGKESQEDISQLLAMLKDGQAKQGVLRLSPIGARELTAAEERTGWLFGGCFSVLTNLIATPYLPRSLAGALLLFEDTGENYGRMLRYWNQWLQSGMFAGVRGIVLGRFSDLEAGTSETELKAEFARRCSLPCWSSDDFGHVSPNFPFVIGAQGSIAADGSQLRWKL